MKKRGEIPYKALFEIILSAVIVIAFIGAGKSYGSEEAFYKLAVAKDLALTIDLIYALPGSIEYTYPNDVSDYDLEITQNSINVYSHNLGKTDPTRASYRIAGISSDSISANIEAKKFIRIEKANGKVKITGVAQ